MAYITFPHNGAFPGIYDTAVYRGTSDSALNLGVVRKRLMDIPRGPIEHHHGTELIEPGHRMVRSVTPGATSGDPDTFGPWIALRAIDQYEGVWDGRLVNSTEHLVSVVPGENMRDPDGFIIYPYVAQPASGEQARHEWTGELLFEANGTTPILEP